MNKYKDYSNIIKPKPGEILQTYGVQFINNPEVKRKHSPYHPFLVLQKDNNQYLSLKVSSKNGFFSTNCRINVEKYPQNDVIVTDSFIDTRCIYNLELYDFTKHGITLSGKDFQRVYNSLIKAYCFVETNITDTLAKTFFKKYMEHKRIQPGSLLKLPNVDELYLILEVEEDYYRCLPLYRQYIEESDDILKINGYNNFIIYGEERILTKDEIFYILSFDVGHGLMDEIQFKKANNYSLKPEKNK